MKMTKKIRAQVRTDAVLTGSFLEKALKTGLKIPVDTTPRMITAKKGAMSLPARKIAMQNRAIKKTKTAFGEIFCSTGSPLYPSKAWELKRTKPCKAVLC
jgi:hypothetical protein